MVVLQDQDGGCSGPAYNDVTVHLESRGARATCADYRDAVSAGMSAGEQSEGQECDGSLPEAFARDLTAPSTIEYMRVPDVVGLDPSSAYDVAQESGLRVSNGRVGSWSVVSHQTPAAGSRAVVGSGIQHQHQQRKLTSASDEDRAPWKLSRAGAPAFAT